MSVATPDFVVIGGGIAGASAAYELQARGSTLLLEREALAGQHTTGRSAAFLVESYGKPVVQRLTRATRRFLEALPEGFATSPVLSPRPSLTIARADQAQRLADAVKLAVEAGANRDPVDVATAEAMCPVLRPGSLAAAVVDPDDQGIDVAELLAGYLRAFRARGGRVSTGREVTGLTRDGEAWEVRCGSERIVAKVVVNAAGAWGERVGALAGVRPIGLQPLRRTAITFDPPSGANVLAWPCVVDADEDFYFKPEGRVLLASPCDETPMEPHDVTPEDFEIALVADRLQRATTLEIRHIGRSWAGLRNFVADREPVIGIDPAAPGFCWIAGQGGFGIMTAPAAARTVAQLVTSGELPEDIRACGLAPADYSPERLLRSGKTEGDSPMVARA